MTILRISLLAMALGPTALLAAAKAGTSAPAVHAVPFQTA